VQAKEFTQLSLGNPSVHVIFCFIESVKLLSSQMTSHDTYSWLQGPETSRKQPKHIIALVASCGERIRLSAGSLYDLPKSQHNLLGTHSASHLGCTGHQYKDRNKAANLFIRNK
jgi:hypothetical protein